MDLRRTDPRFSTRSEVLDDVCGPLEPAGQIMYPDLWLSEKNAGSKDACQEGEDYRRVGTRRGAHLRRQGGKKRTRGDIVSGRYKLNTSSGDIRVNRGKCFEGDPGMILRMISWVRRQSAELPGPGHEDSRCTCAPLNVWGERANVAGGDRLYLGLASSD